VKCGETFRSGTEIFKGHQPVGVMEKWRKEPFENREALLRRRLSI